MKNGIAEINCGEIFESPGRVLALLNRHLYRGTPPEKYATLFLAHYEGKQNRLTYSNGGQLPPLVLRADHGVTRLDQGGTVVGLMDGMSYDEGTVHLKSGDIVIAYSDGVTEPENEFGISARSGCSKWWVAIGICPWRRSPISSCNRCAVGLAHRSSRTILRWCWRGSDRIAPRYRASGM